MHSTQRQELDATYIWHPFTQAKTAKAAIPIKSARGIELVAEDGTTYWDLISSWWVNMHGHAHPKIAAAIAEQAQKLEHVIFTDFTHAPATQLAQDLMPLLPKELKRIFFSDNGSTAVEVALKMAQQYWYNEGKPEKKNFIAFDKAYHGDTFGAMSVGKTSGYFKPFEGFLFPVDIIPYPETWIDDESCEAKEAYALQALVNLLEERHHTTAAFILEPCLQGAGGMRFTRPEFVKKITETAQKYNVLVIFDEIVTGFGRTGDFFACLKAKVTPDIICLAKGLTGGFLPLSVTITTEEIYKAFLGDDHEKAFLHGHSYTANPISCAAAVASLGVFKEENTLLKIQEIEKIHQERLLELRKTNLVKNCRVMGDVAAFDLCSNQSSQNMKALFLSQGLLLRPLGNVVYLMPPYCITKDQLQQSYDKIEYVISNS